ncbi:hypothetical protein BJV82DRAFT_600354 [Fennellomyces sp. T-0311]|nr:hypothetical protein BJV82DRAFT_600354 [Fennellomyces sp. T-0311]
MSNINQETCMVLNELRSRIPPKTSYNLIGDELKTEYALILEKRCKAFNVHLDKCKNSWITRWLLMYKYGNQYQGKKKIERNNDTPDPLGGSSSAPDGDIRSARTSSPVPSPAGPSTISSNFSTLATSPNSLTRSSTASSIDRMMSRSSLTRADTDLSEEQDSDDEENNEEIQELLRQLNEARARSRKGKEPERNVRRRISGP